MTEPLRPNMSCIATAPTKGGMMSGSTPERLYQQRAAELETHGEIGERHAMSDAITTDMPPT